MLKKIFILLIIAIVAGIGYYSVYLYGQWNKLNAQLDKNFKSGYAFVDLCRTESKDKKCMQVVSQFYAECKNNYQGANITFLNVRDESIKYLKATYHCIETKSHYNLPSLGDYLLNISGKKARPRTQVKERHVAENADTQTTATKIDFTKFKEKFVTYNINACMKYMLSIKPEKRKQYCDCAVSIMRSNIKDSDIRLYANKKIDFTTLTERSGGNYDSCQN